jgi:hypothetical protein
MSTPEPAPHDAEEDNDSGLAAPPAAPAYSTPPTTGIPDADTEAGDD